MELWRVFRTLEEHVANPVLDRLLRSRVHWPLSEWYCLLSYEGTVSGERYTTPVAYSRSDDIVHVVAVRERSAWWKNFRDLHECTLYLNGEPRDAVGEVVTNAVKHQTHVARFLHPVPALAGEGGERGEGGLDDSDFTSYVLVEFMLDPSETDTTSEGGEATTIPVESGHPE